jgi:excisionase family DNA binding protein
MSRQSMATVEDVANYCDVSDRTVRRWLHDGLKHYKVGPGQQGSVRIKWSDLDAWLEAHAVEHTR